MCLFIGYLVGFGFIFVMFIFCIVLLVCICYMKKIVLVGLVKKICKGFLVLGVNKRGGGFLWVFLIGLVRVVFFI